MFRVEAIVARSGGIYLVTMDLPGHAGVQASFEIEPPELDELAVLHPPAIIAEVAGPDTRPFRPLYEAVGTFHKAAIAVPVRLRALRVDRNSSYVGTVQPFDGEAAESTFEVRTLDSGEWAVPVPANLRRFAGPDDENVAQVLRAVIEFHKAVQIQI